jgi:hypothetical protein
VKVWRLPGSARPRRIRDRTLQRRRIAASVAQPCRDALLQRGLALEHGREPRAVIARRGRDGHVDSIERKHVAAARGRFEPLGNRVDNRLCDFKRLVRT